jgi:hypothetical protein
VTQEPFPALIHLNLQYYEFDEYGFVTTLAIPDGFLGGSAPRLRSLELVSIPFPTLPKLLLSTTDLIYLRLWQIPNDGNISPKEFVTSLAALPKLESLIMEFDYPHLLPDRGHPTRIVLPALTHFQFRGKSEYLEVLVAGIDAPLLDTIFITFSDELTFDIPELARFMRRTTRFQALNEAHVDFGYYSALVKSLPVTETDFDEESGLKITCREIDWSPTDLTHVFTSLFPSIYIVEHLYIYGCRLTHGFRLSQLQGPQRNIEIMQWLDIFRPFTAVKKLYVSHEFAHYIAPALQQLVGERTTDVLPALESLFLEKLPPSGPVQEAFGQFIAARQLFGHPVAVSHWERR